MHSRCEKAHPFTRFYARKKDHFAFFPPLRGSALLRYANVSIFFPLEKKKRRSVKRRKKQMKMQKVFSFFSILSFDQKFLFFFCFELQHRSILEKNLEPFWVFQIFHSGLLLCDQKKFCFELEPSLRKRRGKGKSILKIVKNFKIFHN